MRGDELEGPEVKALVMCSSDLLPDFPLLGVMWVFVCLQCSQG